MLNLYGKYATLNSINDSVPVIRDTVNVDVAAPVDLKKGGHPIGITYRRRGENDLAVVATKNDIMITFINEKCINK